MQINGRGERSEIRLQQKKRGSFPLYVFPLRLNLTLHQNACEAKFIVPDRGRGVYSWQTYAMVDYISQSGTNNLVSESIGR